MGPRISYRDKKFGWTFAHAIAGAGQDIPIEIVRYYLRYLKRNGLGWLMWAKDKDGDIPFQSALKTGNCLAEYIELYFEEFPELAEKMLCSTNKKNSTPLHVALEEREWEALDVMLYWCVKNQLLSYLTGFQSRGAHNTLLHRAFKQGYIKYLEILLKVCNKCEMEDDVMVQVLLVPNSKKETPWYYLANRSSDDWKEALLLVKNSKFNIRVDDLTLDVEKKPTLLHKAFRRNDRGLVHFLQTEFSADENLVNDGCLSPKDRNHSLIQEVPKYSTVELHTQNTHQNFEENSRVKPSTPQTVSAGNTRGQGFAPNTPQGQDSTLPQSLTVSVP